MDVLVVVAYLVGVGASLAIGFRYINGARPRSRPAGSAESETVPNGPSRHSGGHGADASTGVRFCDRCGETNADVPTYRYCRSCLGRIR